MDLAMLKYDARVDGEEKGRLEGAKEERLENATETAQQLKNMGLSEQKIETSLNDIFKNKLTPSQIKEIIESADKD